MAVDFSPCQNLASGGIWREAEAAKRNTKRGTRKGGGASTMTAVGSAPMGGGASTTTAVDSAPMGGGASSMTAVGGAPMGGGASSMTAVGGAPMGGGASTTTAVSGAPMGGGASTTTAVGGAPMGGGASSMTAVGGAPMGGGASTTTAVSGAPMGGGASTTTAVGGAPMGGGASSMTAVGGAPMGGGASSMTAVDGASRPSSPPSPVMLNQWIDVRVGDPWPKRPLVKALDKSLNTIHGQNPDQYVALWYLQGEPVMGRAWNQSGKIAANFAWSDHEYTGNVGSIQVLALLPEDVRGFDYHWRPLSDFFNFGSKREFVTVHVCHPKGDISPAVITFNGKQILGKCDVRNEKASAGKEHTICGLPVHHVTQL